ncbi:[Fe-S]-binding protein [Halalkalibacillus sediminis]|uniref:Methylated-DNA--protein-cysteine methyltransferase n=1 Tax=Halalkalibacillus sediminis TaxID=2018042 RepID=A0A2I0QV43_9BACI|nr:methylated-DNA--[protein]-cysteine S-methyltransferase [Halalkalibacillus sediminis]PKR78223.1 [Fe-S]-binding protein [Halalkalibacillus sediminis]
MKKLIVSRYQSPVGPLLIGGDGNKVYFVKYGQLIEHEEWLDRWTQKNRLDVSIEEDDEAYETAKNELDRYFRGQSVDFTFDYHLLGTDFQQKVWSSLMEIPYGETWTYGDIARHINHEKAVRAVGGAINKNPISVVVPCHRVIGSDGTLTGYAGGLDNKQFLLEHEKKHHSTMQLSR